MALDIAASLSHGTSHGYACGEGRHRHGGR